MPAGDRTGPMSEGPITGKGLGYCRGNDYAGNRSLARNTGQGFRRGLGRGPGLGRGRGMGYRRDNGNYFEGSADVSEKTLIENEIRILKDQMAALEGRLTKSKEK